MMLLVTAAFAAECDPAAATARLQSTGSQADYLCVMKAPEGKDLLVPAIVAASPDNERLTRGLTLWLLEHTDQEMDAELISRLAPSDRRLLADGIRARRGRASPSPEHVKVFEQLGWYEPVPNYTDARLRPIDRENLERVDPRVKPKPAAPPAADAAPAKAPVPPPVGADTPNLCGCDTGEGAAAGWTLLLAALVRRRRR